MNTVQRFSGLGLNLLNNYFRQKVQMDPKTQSDLPLNDTGNKASGEKLTQINNKAMTITVPDQPINARQKEPAFKVSMTKILTRPISICHINSNDSSLPGIEAKTNMPYLDSSDPLPPGINAKTNMPDLDSNNPPPPDINAKTNMPYLDSNDPPPPGINAKTNMPYLDSSDPPPPGINAKTNMPYLGTSEPLPPDINAKTNMPYLVTSEPLPHGFLKTQDQIQVYKEIFSGGQVQSPNIFIPQPPLTEIESEQLLDRTGIKA